MEVGWEDMEWIYLARYRWAGFYEHGNENSVAINARNYFSADELLAS
jgi:hypothetical protein